MHADLEARPVMSSPFDPPEPMDYHDHNYAMEDGRKGLCATGRSLSCAYRAPQGRGAGTHTRVVLFLPLSA
jgi:hypothetical protein